MSGNSRLSCSIATTPFIFGFGLYGLGVYLTEFVDFRSPADGLYTLLKGVEKAGTTNPDAVIDAMVGVSVPNLSGGYSTMMPNHHITKPVLIGEIQEDGQFETVYRTPGLVVGDEWSDYLPGSKDLIADWRKPLACGNFNVKTGKCGGKSG